MINIKMVCVFILTILVLFTHAKLAHSNIKKYAQTIESGDFACEERQYVTFGNGIKTNQQGALDALRELQTQVSPKLSSLKKSATNFGNIYNPTANIFLDLWESVNQKKKADIKQYRRWMLGLDDIPSIYEAIFLAPSLFHDPSYFSTSPTTGKHIRQYNSLLSKGRTIAAVTHSQGNLFINEAYFGIHDALLDGT